MTAIAINRGADTRPPISRLTLVELRKMVNTRSGVWVLSGVALVTVIFALVASLNHGGRSGTYVHVFNVASVPSAYLLPVLGILLICGEWTQRTTMATFTLVPSRARVIAAKMLAGLVVSTVALVVTVLVALVFATAFNHVPGGPGALPLALIAQGWLHQYAWMLIGLAFGAAILVSAPAIVSYLLIPMLFSAIVGAFHSLSSLDNWVDPMQSVTKLTLHTLSATGWAQVGVALTLWIGVPLALGLRRICRGEIN